MLKDTQMLVMELTRQGYKVPLVRIGTLVKQGKLFRIIRGLYTDTRTIDPFTVSAAVLQPSYISFESALSVHGLIPEGVPNITAATFGKRRSKTYETDWGLLIYRDVPKKAFSEELKLFENGCDNYLLAGPEKALCDKLYSVSPLRSRKALRTWLFENMRIEEEDFRNLSTVVLNRLSKLYASTNLKLLADALTRKGL